MTVDPSNVMLRDRLAAVEAARAAGERTVPTTIEEELATNPFLRVRCFYTLLLTLECSSLTCAPLRARSIHPTLQHL